MTVAKNTVSWRSSPVFITATVTVGFFCRASLVLLFSLLYLVSLERKETSEEN